ncbi:MAG: hypothetical protein KF817_06340 [Phycisphaeraceae bacterium]|nr:hypothetical protein [Phycisphaeraceae bacterium]
MQRTVPLLIAIVCGFTMIVSFFIPAAQRSGDDVAEIFNILAAVAFVLGGGNLLKIHLKKVSDQAAGWGYSLITVTAFLLTLCVGLFKIGANPADRYPGHAWSGEYSETGSAFWWIYEFVFKPITATMFAMLAFYVASAAFRAFRAKNTEAVLLLGTAFIILLGRTYAGVILTDWLPDSLSGLRFENLTMTIMNVFNTAGSRAIMIGIALGTASVSLKILLGVDRSYLGGGRG